jgi:YggT family protein
MSFLQSIIAYFLIPIVGFLMFVIIIQIIMSWLVAFGVVNLQNPTFRSIYYGLERLVAPMMDPVRRFLPPMGGLDLSPLVVIFALQWIRGWLLPMVYNAV